MREFRLGGHEDDNNSEESILLKFWKILTPEARIAVRSGEEVNIGLINDSSAKEFKRGGGEMYSHHKKACTKFLRLTQSEGKKNDASLMNSVDEFITGCGGTS